MNLDSWTPEQMEVSCSVCFFLFIRSRVSSHSGFALFGIQSIQQWGNKRAAEFWECYLPSDFRRPQTDSYHSNTPVNSNVAQSVLSRWQGLVCHSVFLSCLVNSLRFISISFSL